MQIASDIAASETGRAPVLKLEHAEESLDFSALNWKHSSLLILRHLKTDSGGVELRNVSHNRTIHPNEIQFAVRNMNNTLRRASDCPGRSGETKSRKRKNGKTWWLGHLWKNVLNLNGFSFCGFFTRRKAKVGHALRLVGRVGYAGRKKSIFNVKFCRKDSL
jgi:hypothetical protein